LRKIKDAEGKDGDGDEQEQARKQEQKWTTFPRIFMTAQTTDSIHNKN